MKNWWKPFKKNYLNEYLEVIIEYLEPMIFYEKVEVLFYEIKKSN